MPTVVVAAYNVAGFPEGGGHFWVYLQYVLGLRQLGCEVYWLEAFRTKGRAAEEAAALATFRARMKQQGLDGKVILYVTQSKKARLEAPAEFLDMTRSEAESIFERADLLLNFHYAISPGLLARFRRTALVDIDPGLLQFWISRGQINVPPHHFYFTISENVGQPGGRIPDCGLEWIPIRPAVCLERWPYLFDPHADAFTTVSLWDSGDWVRDRDVTYENTKRVAFLEFADLPLLTSQPLELALFLRKERDMAESKDLERRGWRIRHSRDVAATPERYQAYIQRSRGEFGCSKPSYINLDTAWISDRTACYLASGKPVVIQNTGPSSFLPNGEGMFRFSTVEEAVSAFETINADYRRHCRAAREIAEAYFDSRQIAERILNAALANQRSKGTGAMESRGEQQCTTVTSRFDGLGMTTVT
ncbi:MAG: hypothetical protein DMG06_28320 [Acidobacteria bacterium]|nr:MAG: hypothetical protein DMG06_28320 [Acidobacteriota bacterium]